MLAEMNVLNLKGQLTPEQAAFFASHKPEVELFDLRVDPHEVHNVADDPKYATVKAELLAELENWRKHVIHDQGVSEAFRARNIFPKTCSTPTVDAWVQANADKYDFQKYGWPAWYPTRTLAEWEKARALWEPYVFRGPTQKIPRPQISYSKKKVRKTKGKK